MVNDNKDKNEIKQNIDKIKEQEESDEDYNEESDEESYEETDEESYEETDETLEFEEELDLRKYKEKIIVMFLL